MNRGERLPLVARPVELGHPHAAQPDGRHHGPVLPSRLVFMPRPLPDQSSLTAVPLTLTMSMPFFSPRNLVVDVHAHDSVCPAAAAASSSS